MKHNENKKYIQIWEDLVLLKDLVVSLVICIITTFGCYFIAPKTNPWPLFMGLIGAILGFVISSILIKPKRKFDEDK